MTVSLPTMPTVRKYRRDSSEVSGCLKFTIFGFNVLFWLLGLGILTIGVWAWSEKDIFNNLGRVANFALDPAFVLICIGTVTFIIGFTGCVGALRENTCLLGTIKAQATIGFQTFIIHYREDPDQQNLIDWIQEDWLQCCGIEGPKDWDRNNYFNCSSRDVGSREACGVPFSCCKRKQNVRIFGKLFNSTNILKLQEIIKNKQCGYDVRKPGFPGERHIFERGCLRAGEEWIESNLVPVAAVKVAIMVLQSFDTSKILNEEGCLEALEEWIEANMISIATCTFVLLFLQILGICFAQNLRADIFAQKAKWH
ncbi:hypothetical protein NQ317_015115 [Molorchus minor]|uniref:Tetraspanin n=1 Tax=Molorchus minor TaxID=1323400 RepID=A0ABQ9K4U2_9CUCU|nr:hypothetical protein NQ317_015115 [Molorchus minor]